MRFLCNASDTNKSPNCSRQKLIRPNRNNANSNCNSAIHEYLLFMCINLYSSLELQSQPYTCPTSFCRPPLIFRNFYSLILSGNRWLGKSWLRFPQFPTHTHRPDVIICTRVSWSRKGRKVERKEKKTGPFPQNCFFISPKSEVISNRFFFLLLAFASKPFFKRYK